MTEMEIIPGPQWQDLPGLIMERKGVVMIIGASDSGKSTLVRYLITEILTAGTKVALVDSDIGQTSLGLPGTISLRVFSSDGDLEAFTPERMFFVGAVNPAARVPLIVRFVRTTVEECRNKSDVVLIDTSGLVSGKAGEALKTGEVRAINPERIIAVQRSDEVEHILKLVDGVAICRVISSGMVRSRDTAARMRYRQKKYEDYFGDGGPLEYLVEMREVELFYNGKTPSPKSSAFPGGNVIGLNHSEETLALGLLTEIAPEWVTFRSPLGSIRKINRIVLGDITYRQQKLTA